MQLSAGVLVVEVDGLPLEVEGSFTCQPNTESREAKVSQSGKVGYITTPIPATIEGVIFVTDDITPAWYAGIVNKTASVRLRDGRIYSFRGLSTNGMFEHDTINGTAPFSAFAESGEQL